MPCLDPSIIFSSKENKISGFEINHERMSLCILGDFRIMKWRSGNTLPKEVYRAKIQVSKRQRGFTWNRQSINGCMEAGFGKCSRYRGLIVDLRMEMLADHFGSDWMDWHFDKRLMDGLAFLQTLMFSRGWMLKSYDHLAFYLTCQNVHLFSDTGYQMDWQHNLLQTYMI